MYSTLYEAEAKERLRFALGTSKEDHHGVFWIQVSNDGSIYMDFIETPISDLAFSKIKIENGSTKIPYVKKPHLLVTDKDKLKQHKFSFHSSGTVHSLERTFGTNLRDLNKQTTLCDMIFTDVKKFSKMNDKKKYNNLLLNYKFEEGYPIACKIIVGPYEKIDTLKEVELPVRYQFSTILIYQKLQDIKPLAIQVIFYHNNKAPNPPNNALMWLASDYKTKEEQELEKE